MICTVVSTLKYLVVSDHPTFDLLSLTEIVDNNLSLKQVSCQGCPNIETAFPVGISFLPGHATVGYYSDMAVVQPLSSFEF
jgi:hypothetical protein